MVSRAVPDEIDKMPGKDARRHLGGAPVVAALPRTFRAKGKSHCARHIS